MVALVLRLKLQLLANTFRRSPWQVFGLVLALTYGLGATGVATVVLIGLRFVPPGAAGPPVVFLGSLVTLGFLLIPLAMGSDDTLDPRRFSLFGIGAARLSGMLAAAAVLGVPGLVITAVAGAQVVTWGRSPASAAVALFAAVLIVVTCLLASRVTTALAAIVLATRRAREASGLLALIVLVCLAALIALLPSNSAQSALAELPRVASILGWTPLGAMWSAPADAASGNVLVAVHKLLVASTFTLVLGMAWWLVIARMLVTPHREGSVKTYSGLGWFDRLPANPLGTIAARSFTYWNRDARYRVQLVIVPVVPLLIIATFAVGGIDTRMLALLPLPIMCLFLSWLIHNDVALDNTALWLHVVANTSGRADRLGRIVPILLLGGVLIAIGAPVSAAISGQHAALAVVLGVSVCILLCGLGFSSISSARFPYAAVRPGDSPFTQPQASGGLASAVQSLAFGATLLAASPTIVLGWGALNDTRGSGVTTLVVGVLTGVLVLVFGIVLGARTFDRRGPELLAFTQRN